MRREYKIISSDLWYNIYRKREKENWIMNLEFLWANQRWIKDKTFAKTFYHKDDAISALVTVKMKWRNEQETEEKQKVEKQCWQECW